MRSRSWAGFKVSETLVVYASGHKREKVTQAGSVIARNGAEVPAPIL